MPPNRKTDIALQDFASLDVAHLQQTLKPITTAAAPQRQATKPQQQQDASYWDWPVDEEIQELQCLETAHVEHNLVKEARRLSQKSGTDTIVRSSIISSADSDAYWNMPAEKPLWFDIKRPSPGHHPAPASMNADDYWNESPSTAAAASSDDYWTM